MNRPVALHPLGAARARLAAERPGAVPRQPFAADLLSALADYDLGEEALYLAWELARCVEVLHQAEKTLEERTAWAAGLQAEANELGRRLGMYEASRWVKLGRQFRLGPQFDK